MRRAQFWVLTLGLVAVLLGGCSTVYYKGMELLGSEKRDLLRSSVESARDSQAKASEQFKDALTRLKEVYAFDGGDLEKGYSRLKSEYESSASRADTVKSRIEKVSKIAHDLFQEWDKEASGMSSERLATSSRERLRETQSRFKSLESSMKKAEQSMSPVLSQLKDQVLYLKHNLNAQAIASLKGESLDIEKEIGRLIRDMNQSIAEADSFIKGLP